VYTIVKAQNWRLSGLSFIINIDVFDGYLARGEPTLSLQCHTS
jgi:hypothetical protein